MATKKQKTILIACTTISLNISAGELIYIVKKGESLSSILNDQNHKPIYGKHGILKKTLKLNPKISKRYENKIFPGEKIKLAGVNSENKIVSTERPLPEYHETRLGGAPTPSLPAISSPNNSRTISSDDREQYVFFRIAPQVSWMKATSSSSDQYQVSQVSAISKASPGVLGAFGVNVREDVNVQVFSYLSEVNFYQDGNYSISKKSFFRQAYGVGGEYSLDPINRFSLKCGFFDEIYLTMNNTTTINVETAQIPEVHWGYRRVLGQYKNVTLDSGIFGKFILPYSASTITGKFGYGLGGDFLLMFKNNKGLRLFYNYSDAKAQNKSTKTMELGWSVVFEGRTYE